MRTGYQGEAPCPVSTAHHQVHRVWITTLLFFAFTTAAAMLVALVAANLFRPGAGMSLAMFADAMQDFEARQMTMPEFFRHFLTGLFKNPFEAFTNGDILSVRMFAIFVGIALVAGGNRYHTILQLMQELMDMLLRIISWIMWLAPLGIAALLIRLVAEQDVALLTSMLGFIVLIFATTLFHGAVVLPGILYTVTRKSPL